MTDEAGNQFSRSGYINNLKEIQRSEKLNIAHDQLVQLIDPDDLQSEEDNSSLSDQSEAEKEIQQHQDDGDMRHNVDDSTY